MRYLFCYISFYFVEIDNKGYQSTYLCYFSVYCGCLLCLSYIQGAVTNDYFTLGITDLI